MPSALEEAGRRPSRRRAFETRSCRAGGQGRRATGPHYQRPRARGITRRGVLHQGIGTLVRQRVPGDPARAELRHSHHSRADPRRRAVGRIGPPQPGGARTNDPGLFCLRGRSQPGRVHGSALPTLRRKGSSWHACSSRNGFANQGSAASPSTPRARPAAGGRRNFFCLSTQAFNFSCKRAGFVWALPTIRPPTARTLRPQRPEVAGTRQTSHPDAAAVS